MLRTGFLCRLLPVLVVLAVALPVARSDDQEDDLVPKRNPYLAPADLKVDQLTRFIQRMQSKPETIRKRSGFVEAVIDAAERVLNAEPDDKQRTVAALNLMDVLHNEAVLGDQQADDKLMAWAQKLASDSQEKIVHAAGLHLLEKRAMASRKQLLSDEELTKLYTELKDYLADEKLTRKHLRLASETIGVLNRLSDRKAAEKHFDELGGLLAKASDADLARYGRQISKKPGEPGGGGPKPSALVGKELELEGVTVDNLPFDWASYRGKVVLVDFWATWCGPCRAELPNVLANYQKYHDRGFDVVGISLDNDLETLQEFIAEQGIPWTNLYDDASKGWKNPIAQKYNVRAIPTVLLVGKDGKVITANARGAALEQQLEKLLGDGAEGGEKDKAPAEKKNEEKK